MADTIAKATDSQILFALVARATVARMDGKDLYAWRRERLAELAQKRGGNAALGRELGYRDGAFVGQMIRGIRPITEKTVSAAHALPGAAGWFYLDQEAVSAMQSTSSAGGGLSVANAAAAASALANALEVLAASLNELPDARRELAAQHLQTLARAPDSKRAREALLSTMLPAALGPAMDKVDPRVKTILCSI